MARSHPCCLLCLILDITAGSWVEAAARDVLWAAAGLQDRETAEVSPENCSYLHIQQLTHNLITEHA